MNSPCLLTAAALLCATAAILRPSGAAPVPRGATAFSGWPMLGGGPSRNHAHPYGNGVPDDFGVDLVRKKKILPRQKRLLWSARLGNHAYGGPVSPGRRLF